ncbi:ClcB-like voltage-gated chloride channel protein [Pelistega europaea]|uniref:ClcB-like voltage-gated chloride channel protein n=1 Tax=Pelistega europaea TaxID=106147 RepID=A0A7Y4L8E6_9BURK|nr:ClcB-like voltage-gated chloride channel protein [Pelistega europaea]NOL48890.1 ClcB-like voltage-gated chloride channel protein [Pelistega europaea]
MLNLFRHCFQQLRTYLTARSKRLFSQTAILIWAAILGFTGALTTISFHELIKLIQTIHSGHSGDVVDIARSWSVAEKLIIPTLSGVIAGFCLYLASRIKVDANSDYMEAVAIGNGRLSLRQGLLRIVSALCVSATGWSLGREGPIIHWAAMSGSVVGRFFRLEPRHMRLLVACGAAAGVSAAYFAPIAGALFVAEIVLGSMATQVLVPLLTSSAISYITIQSLGYRSWLYEIPSIDIVGHKYIVLSLVVGAVSGIAAPLFLRYLDKMKQLFSALKLPEPISLALGGFLLGCLFLVNPWVAGKGDTLIHSYIVQTWSLSGVFIILSLNILSTGFSVGSGAVGGVITPVMLVGASVALLIVKTVGLWSPEAEIYTHLFILVGMGAFLGAATSAPILAVVLIVEMSHSFNVIAPLILATVLSYYISRKVTNKAMFAVVEHRDKSDEVRVALSKLKIKSLINPATTVLTPQHTMNDVVNMFAEHSARYIYIVNDQQEFLGVISVQDMTRALVSQKDLQQPIPPDLLERTYIEPLNIAMSLDQAQDRFVNFTGERLPMVDLQNPPHLVGVVYKSDVLRKFSELKRIMDESSQAAADIRLS